MKANPLLTLAASFGLGGLATWALPASWFLPAFLTLIGVTLLLGIVNAVNAKEQNALHPGMQVLSFLLLNTSRPNAVIEPSSVFVWFLRSAAGTLGMGTAIVLLAHA